MGGECVCSFVRLFFGEHVIFPFFFSSFFVNVCSEQLLQIYSFKSEIEEAIPVFNFLLSMLSIWNIQIPYSHPNVIFIGPRSPWSDLWPIWIVGAGVLCLIFFNLSPPTFFYFWWFLQLFYFLQLWVVCVGVAHLISAQISVLGLPKGHIVH